MPVQYLPHIVQQTTLHQPSDRRQQGEEKLAQLRINEFMCREDEVCRMQHLIRCRIPLVIDGNIGQTPQCLLHHFTPCGHKTVQQHDSGQRNAGLVQQAQDDFRLETM